MPFQTERSLSKRGGSVWRPYWPRDGAKRAPSGYSEGEMTAIMEALSDGGRYNHTYDGRPVLVRMAPDEIRKLFRK